MSSYRKRRQEIIDNWLEGKENDEYDVIPTQTEGKYILRHKQKQTKDTEQISSARGSFGTREQTTVQEDIKTENNDEESKIEESNVSEEPVDVNAEPVKNNPANSSDLSMEILNQLKLMNGSFNEFNEERRRKQEKKAKKKEMKRIIHKQFAKNRVMIEGSDEEENEVEPQVVYIEKPAPVRIRRRLNLLDKYSPR